MYKVLILEPALQDLNEAIGWYNYQNKALGISFFEEVDYYIKAIQNNPFLFAVKFSEKFRFANLKKFPFRIVYKVDEENKLIYINYIFHTKKDPSKF